MFLATDELEFVHRYVPPVAGRDPAARTTLLLLHGTGGNEEDLLPLGQTLLPGAALLSPRGQVLERGMPRFFRRLSEGVFDEEDLARRTEQLGRFVTVAGERNGFDASRVIAVGFSNGANIASSLLLRRPGLLQGAVLLSPMVPFEPEDSPNLAGTAVFIGAGRADPISPPAQVERLAGILQRAGAEVTLHWHAGGHELTPGEVAAAGAWLGRIATRED